MKKIDKDISENKGAMLKIGKDMSENKVAMLKIDKDMSENKVEVKNKIESLLSRMNLDKLESN